MALSSVKKRISSYLPNLSPEGVVGQSVVESVNYLLNSYFFKIDERQKRLDEQYRSMPRRNVPENLEAHIRKIWLGCDLSKCETLASSYPHWAIARNAWAFEKLFAGDLPQYNRVPFLDHYEFGDLLSDNYNWSVNSSILSIGLGVSATIPVFGTYFVECPSSGAHLLVSFDMGYNSFGCALTVVSAPENKKDAEVFLSAMESSLVANDVYFKKTLSYDCGKLDFIKLIPTSWDQIVLKDDIKNCVIDNSINVLKHMDDLSSLGMCPNRNGILISPPGMAKTTIFRAISNDLLGQATTIWCTGKSIDSPEDVSQLFEAARGLAPCVIFIEDMDLFGRERNSEFNGSNPRVLNEFLACLDGASENRGVVVLASTNDISSMDEALIDRPGRFDVKIEIPFPDFEDRSKMLVRFLREYNVKFDSSITKDTWKNIIDATDGLTGAYLKDLAKSALLSAVSSGRCTVDDISKVCIVCSDDILNAVNQIMKNFHIGKRAKKHIEIDGHLELSKS